MIDPNWPRPNYVTLPSFPDGRPRVRLLEPWKAPSGYVVRAPFISDMSSIPAPFWGLFRPRDAAIAGILHDCQCIDAKRGFFSFRRANREWLEVAIALDRLIPWKACVAYAVLEIHRILLGRK